MPTRRYKSHKQKNKSRKPSYRKKTKIGRTRKHMYNIARGPLLDNKGRPIQLTPPENFENHSLSPSNRLLPRRIAEIQQEDQDQYNIPYNPNQGSPRSRPSPRRLFGSAPMKPKKKCKNKFRRNKSRKAGYRKNKRTARRHRYKNNIAGLPSPPASPPGSPISIAESLGPFEHLSDDELAYLRRWVDGLPSRRSPRRSPRSVSEI